VPSSLQSGPFSTADEETKPVFGDRYEVLSLLGSGGMGTVYMARDRELDEIVALKVLRDEAVSQAGALELFRREVKLARRVTHPNVARTFDIGEYGGSKYLTMEFVEGTSLARILDRHGALPVARAVEIVQQIAAGLSAAHAVGVVHRDLKPENVLVRKDDRVLITDFGVARPVDSGSASVTMGIAVGTPAYMAPEQVEAKRDVDGRADIYALGVLLFELLTGELPFSGDSALAVAAARLVQAPPDVRKLRPDVPDGLAEIVAKCLARDRAQRFASTEQLLSALSTLTTPLPAATGPDRKLADAGPAPSHKAVAVLPFKSAPGDDAFTAEGIWEDLIDALSMTEGLRVRPASSVARHATQGRDPREVGQQLGVDVVVEGSLRSSGDALRISARLLNVADGFQLWAKRFDRSKGEIFALSDEIADTIAKALTLNRQVPARAAVNETALEFYMKARAEYRRVFADGLERAIDYFEQCLERAPNEPTFLAGYAVAQIRRSFFGHVGAAELARSAAEKALALAPHLAEARHALSLIKLHSGDTRGAIAELCAILDKSPYGPAYESLGGILSEIGLGQQAHLHTEEALKIDPDSLFGHLQLAREYALEGRWKEAEMATSGVYASASVRRDASAALLRFMMWRRDMDPRVFKNFEGSVGPLGPELVRILAAEHDVDVASASAAFAKHAGSGSTRRTVLMHQIEAEVAGLRNLTDWAIQAIQRAIDAGLFDIVWLRKCPLLSDARSDPRFAPLEQAVAARAAELVAEYVSH
jgi:serine/threonine-protein kinase